MKNIVKNIESIYLSRAKKNTLLGHEKKIFNLTILFHQPRILHCSVQLENENDMYRFPVCFERKYQTANRKERH